MSNNQAANMKLTISNSSADSRKLAEFLQQFASAHAIAPDILHDLRLAMEETFTNIVDYAHAEKNRHSVTVELEYHEQHVVVRFIDSGIAFNPLADCNNCMETNRHEHGGMGIHLIRSLTDSQEYQRIDDRNIFTLIKYYTKEQT